MWLNWGKALSLQLRHDSTLTDQSGKHDTSSALSKFMHHKLDAVDNAPCYVLSTFRMDNLQVFLHTKTAADCNY